MIKAITHQHNKEGGYNHDIAIEKSGFSPGGLLDFLTNYYKPLLCSSPDWFGRTFFITKVTLYHNRTQNWNCATVIKTQDFLRALPIVYMRNIVWIFIRGSKLFKEQYLYL